MYTDTSLYYLGQLGIRPWIKKDTVHGQQVGVSQISLIVFIPQQISAKAANLYRSMLHFINTSEQPIHIVEVNSPTKHKLTNNKLPSAIWLFGVKQTDLPENTYNCPIISTPAPDDLLNQTINKKTVLCDLIQLKKILSQVN